MPFKFNELAAAFKERGFVLAQLMNPFGERGERIGSRVSAAKVYDNLIYEQNINRLA